MRMSMLGSRYCFVKLLKIWCDRRDLNPHPIARTATSRQRGCHYATVAILLITDFGIVLFKLGDNRRLELLERRLVGSVVYQVLRC